MLLFWIKCPNNTLNLFGAYSETTTVEYHSQIKLEGRVAEEGESYGNKTNVVQKGFILLPLLQLLYQISVD